MFGIIRPCRNRLTDDLRSAWTAHLCGLCLSLRDRRATPGAGPCALRGMRAASVAIGGSAELAASVSLLLASAKISDHVADGDVTGALRTRAARSVAARWARAGRDTGAGLDGVPACAVVAGRPENAETLAEAGRLFGRVAHLLDAVADLAADGARGAWNPIRALDLDPREVRALCDDATLGISLALRDATFEDGRLVHALLGHEVRAAVRRTFAAAGQAAPLTPPLRPDQQPPDGAPIPPGTGWEAPPETPTTRNPWIGCLGWLVVCGTCQACCAGEFTDPGTGRKRDGLCRGDSCGDCACDGCSDCCCDGCGCDCGC